MEYRELGQTGMRVSVLGFGGSEIGYQDIDEKTVEAVLRGALDAGLNVIDTAACYFRSESLIGRAVSDRRDDFFVLTKCGHAAGLSGDDWNTPTIEGSIERSLRRLRTDHLDVVQLHSCSVDILARGDVVYALERARKAGKTRFIGYSGDGADAVHAVESGSFDTLQISLSIADQEAITMALPKAAARGMGVIVKRPIANAAWLSKGPPPNEYHRPYWERLRRLDYDFLATDPAGSVGVALRFTLSTPGVDTAIVGTTKPHRWEQNSRLLEAGPLPPAEYERIRRRWQSIAGPDWAGQR